MSLYNNKLQGKSPSSGFLMSGLLVFCALFLSACGFRPLYGTSQSDSQAADQHLALIQVSQISDRVGQQLRNHLLSRLSPKGEPSDPYYSLQISLTESVANLGVKKSAVVTRGNLTLTASYSLISLKGSAEEALASGSVISISSYDIPQAQYTALAAAKDARARAVRELADDLKIRLAVYFKQHTE